MEKINSKTENYNGYQIVYNTSKTSHCCIIYLDGKIVKCIAGAIFADGSNDRIEKSQRYIDSLNQLQIG